MFSQAITWIGVHLKSGLDLIQQRRLWRQADGVVRNTVGERRAADRSRCHALGEHLCPRGKRPCACIWCRVLRGDQGIDPEWARPAAGHIASTQRGRLQGEQREQGARAKAQYRANKHHVAGSVDTGVVVIGDLSNRKPNLIAALKSGRECYKTVAEDKARAAVKLSEEAQPMVNYLLRGEVHAV